MSVRLRQGVDDNGVGALSGSDLGIAKAGSVEVAVPKRVLHLLYSSAVGGMETLCVQLAEELVRHGSQVLAVLPDAPDIDILAERFQAAGVQVERFHFDRQRGRMTHIPRIARLLRIFWRWRPDVIHLHTGDAHGAPEAVIAARCFTGATVIVTEHDIPSLQAVRLNRVGSSIKDRMAHGLVAVSRRNAALRMERSGAPDDKFSVVLNGVELSGASDDERLRNRAGVRAEARLADGDVVLGCVVRLAEGKGLRDLLRAFALVRERHACKLLLVGDGPLRDELESLAADLGIAGDVRFTGFQKHPARFVDAMDAFVLAVPSGSMSIALLEAMDRAVPPVITFGGPEEAVIPEETGLTAPPSDPEGLAEALMRLVSDEALRQRLGRAAAEHVRRHYSIGRMAGDYLAVYSGARKRTVPARLRADAPPTQRPGDR